MFCFVVFFSPIIVNYKSYVLTTEDLNISWKNTYINMWFGWHFKEEKIIFPLLYSLITYPPPKTYWLTISLPWVEKIKILNAYFELENWEKVIAPWDKLDIFEKIDSWDGKVYFVSKDKTLSIPWEKLDNAKFIFNLSATIQSWEEEIFTEWIQIKELYSQEYSNIFLMRMRQ